MMLSQYHKEIVDYVIDYVGDATDDWFTIKRELVNAFPPRERSNFSRRHYSTKKHVLNEFDREVIRYWEQQVGINLIIDEGKLHPDTWVRKPRGWALQEINEERRKKKASISS